MGLRPVLLSVLIAVARAEEPAPQAGAGEASAAAPLFAVEADLRDEYLAGEPVVVTLGIRNDGAETRNFPDLSRRAHLVRFTVTPAGGRAETRYSTPPDPDLDHVWRVAPGTRREVLLEVPSSRVLPAGRYTVEIAVVDGDRRLLVPTREIRVAEPRPVAATGPFHAGIAEKAGLQAAWVHRGASGHQLYLHAGDARDPKRSLGQTFLAEADGAIEPILAWSMPAQAWGRHVYWSSGANRLRIVQLQGPGRAGDVHEIELPWPRVEPFGVGATDGASTLHAPVWIPAPSGSGGEIRVLSWKAGAPSWRRVATFDARPDRVTTGMDGAGNLRIVLHHGSKVDLYTVEAARAAELPARGVRVDVPPEATLLASAFGTLPAGPDAPGGFALLLVERVATADGGAVRGRWVSPSGATLRTLEPRPAPPGDIAGVLPVGEDYALLVRAEGALRAWPVEGEPVAIAGSDAELVQDAKGATWIRTWGPGAPTFTKL